MRSVSRPVRTDGVLSLPQADHLFASTSIQDVVPALAKLFGHHHANSWIVVAHQDQPLAALRSLDRTGRSRIGRPRRPRQLHPQGRSRTAMVRLCPDRSAVLLDDAAADRQAEPGSALLARVRRLHLLEAIELSLSSLSAGIPRPWSTTLKSSELGFESIWTATVEPTGENFTAFDRRFVSTCRIRSESASK